MTVRHTLLAVGAVLVMGIAIYLVREVSRAPSDAQARTERPAPVPVTPPPPTTPTVAPAAPPTRAVLPSAPPKPAEVAVAPDRPATLPLEVQPPEHANLQLRANPKLDAVMAEANRAYDQGDFDEAKQIAQKVLEKTPGNVRMLRIIVSSECIGGDSAEAQKYFVQLPAADRAQMRTRCDRYGVTLRDP